MPLCVGIILAVAAAQAQKNGHHAKEVDDDTALALNDASDDVPSSTPNITPSFVEGKTSIDLLPLEQSLTILEHPISTISFYRTGGSRSAASTTTSDLDTTLAKLEGRVQAVVQANPWLGGWLVRGKGIGSFDNTPRLWYDPTGKEAAPTIFQKMTHDQVPLDRDTDFIDYETILRKTSALVKHNAEIVNRKEEPLFRITVIPGPDDAIVNQDDKKDIEITINNNNNNNQSTKSSKGFALLASMSHLCGDGHTFYRIYNMILGAAPITSLTPKRVPLFGQKVVELMGRQEANYVSHITSDPLWAKFFRRESSNANDEEDDGSQLRGRIFLVNRHWVGNIKASRLGSSGGNRADVLTSTLRSPMSDAFLYELESAQNPTQSTNDIIVSWFWNTVQPDVGMMTVNLRKRVDVVSEDHAGNYHNPISYTKDDYKSAELIRESLRLCRRVGAVGGITFNNNPPTVLPRAHPEVTFSIITNWSSFRPLSDALLEQGSEKGEEEDETNWNMHDSVQLIRHLPIIYPKRMAKTMPKRMSFLVIFSSGPDDIGCFLMAPGRVMDEIDSCGIVKEMVAQF